MSGFDCRCGHSWVSHYVDWPRACSRCECQALSRAAMPPAPPSALSGVSAEECRELAEQLECLARDVFILGHTLAIAKSQCRAASILRALAESMEGGKE